jgi:hypothetical protein
LPWQSHFVLVPNRLADEVPWIRDFSTQTKKGFGVKAFVRSKDTQLYLAHDGNWVQERSKAVHFNNASEALEHCLARKIERVRIVLNMGKNEYDLDLDLEHPWKTFLR